MGKIYKLHKFFAKNAKSEKVYLFGFVLWHKVEGCRIKKDKKGPTGSMQGEGKGYVVTTWRFRLYSKHRERFLATKQIYSQIVCFYLHVILSQGLQKETSYILQRKVEIFTQGEKSSGTLPICAFPFEKVPLYLRRAAFNEAAGLASHTEKSAIPETVDTSPVYYKGMYRKFDVVNRSIELKLYTGEKWEWARYRFSMDGRVWKEGMELLSPTIVVKEKEIFLHVPVRQIVEDVRPVRERIGERYLCAAFAMGEALAGCIAVDLQTENDLVKKEDRSAGRMLRMIYGGGLFRKRRERLEEELRKAVVGVDGRMESRRTVMLRKKLSELIRREAHRVSKEILSFAIEQRCKVIVVPDYQGNLGFNHKKWIPYSDYDWIARKCIEFLSYKSFQNGIVLCRVPSKDLSRYCSRCGAEFLPAKAGESGRLCRCRNGHNQNRILNTAENAGKRYEKLYGREQL